jgi:hypothetical protein
VVQTNSVSCFIRIVDEKEAAPTKEIGLEGFTIRKEFGRDLHWIIRRAPARFKNGFLCEVQPLFDFRLQRPLRFTGIRKNGV